MRVTIVGLGPGVAEWVTPAARARLHAAGARVFVRTRHLPHVDDLLAGTAWESFDAVYDSAATFSEINAAIATKLLECTSEDVVLAVPGDGVLGEQVIERLLAGGAQVELVPGVPLGIGALAAARQPASDGAQMVEATSLGGNGVDLLIELNPRWPAVVTGVFNPRVAGDLKLALLRVYPPDHLVSLVHHPGLADQAVAQLTLARVDRAPGQLDHLTHVVLPAIAAYVPVGSAHELRAIVARLRAPAIGCPWDLEQSHRTLVPYVVEEAYEVVEAIEDDDAASLADELGDLLLQVVLHAEIADQAGEFEWNDVVRNISEKLIRRHPHVFGEVQVRGASDVIRNWAQLKAAERSHAPEASALDGVSRSLPQLKRAAELARRAVDAGFQWPTREGTLDKVREELRELLEATSLAERREELGDLLWIIAKLALDDGIDAEEALRGANRKFIARFTELERIARERGWGSLSSRPFADLTAAWGEAKRRVRAAAPERQA